MAALHRKACACADGGLQRRASRLWRGRGRALLAPVAYVDIDGTVAPTQGEKKTGMDLSYKGIWGYQPLIISLANTGEVLYIVNRPGNLPSHTGAAEWIDRAVRSGRAACRSGVPAWGYAFCVVLAVRQVEPEGGLHLRHPELQDAGGGRGSAGRTMRGRYLSANHAGRRSPARGARSVPTRRSGSSSSVATTT